MTKEVKIAHCCVFLQEKNKTRRVDSPGNLDPCPSRQQLCSPQPTLGYTTAPTFSQLAVTSWQTELGMQWAGDVKIAVVQAGKSIRWCQSEFLTWPCLPPPLPFLCHFLITSLSLILRVLLSASFSCQSELYTTARVRSSPTTYTNSATRLIPWNASKVSQYAFPWKHVHQNHKACL